MSEKINWAKIMEDNREAIEEKILEAKKETNGTMQGWHVDVEINEKGEAWTSGPNSVGSQSMASWKGETFIVTHVNSWEVDTNEAEDIKYHEKLNAEFQAQQEDENGYEYEWEFMENKYPEIREQWRNDARDFELDEFDPREILDRVIEDEENFHRYD